MNPEERKMLEESLTLSRETHALVKKMRKSMLVSAIMRGVYWFILIGITVGAFYFIQPYLETIVSVYGGVLESAGFFAF